MIQKPWVYFFLFALSGFAGLIYESIWSHYLKLFLGHAAYAQTLVLAIFMGGMALGSWLAGKLGKQWKNLLLGYAVAEFLIGLFGLIFHLYFTSVTGIAFESVIPIIGQPLLVDLFKWSLASLLIFPQTILLGMTFPLMSAGILRRFPEQRGESIATLYFTNSIGATIGVLVSGFYLVDKIGLPGTVMAAGMINLVLAAVVMFLSLSRHQAENNSAVSNIAQVNTVLDNSNTNISSARIFLLAAFITGAASFIYEVSWIRMLSLVLGSTIHSFELMLSAFILGLALGSLWIRRRIDKIKNPVLFAGGVQIFMGIMALATLLFYNQSFEWMATLVKSLSTTDSAYRLFLGGGYLISTAIMLPATFCAGMTLPLFTTVMLRSNYGERAIGNIYAANTIGAIVGVMFAVHIGFEWLGLKGLVVTGALLDIGLGLFIFWRLIKPVPFTRLVPMGAISLVVLAVVIFGVKFDPQRLASAVYRTGATEIKAGSEVVFLEDGKTATISVSTNQHNTASIATNGKPDAALSLDENKRTLDEATMTLAGVLPLLLNPDAETVANIGFGSGQTTHTLLSSDKLKRIDTIEIERQMIEGAKVFKNRVSRAYEDERSHFYIDDAKTFFARNQHQYDIIVSEPSNPWVTGTATLFSKEFYQHIKHYLKDDSLFVQWVQLYEINIDLVMTVFSALNDEFSDYHMYYAGPKDLLILAKKNGDVPFLNEEMLAAVNPKTLHAINRLDIKTMDDLRSRWVGDKALYSPLIKLGKYPVNSDYYPVLEQKAPKVRFQRHTANEISDIRKGVFPLIEAARPQVSLENYYLISKVDEQENAHAADIWASMNSVLFRGQAQPILKSQIPALTTTDSLKKSSLECANQSQAEYWVYKMTDMVTELFPNIDKGRRVHLVKQFAPDCEGEGKAEMLAWHQFYKAFSVQHWPGTVAAATRLMKLSKLRIRERDTELVLGAALMGLSLSGEDKAAVELWKEYGDRIYPAAKPPLAIQLVLAKSWMRQQDETTNSVASVNH